MIVRSVERTNQTSPNKAIGIVYRKVNTSPVPTSLLWGLITSKSGQKVLAKVDSRLYFSGSEEFINDFIDAFPVPIQQQDYKLIMVLLIYYLLLAD